MRVFEGDLIAVRGRDPFRPGRRAMVLEAHAGGTAPYRVRWMDDEREALLVPSGDVVTLVHAGPHHEDAPPAAPVAPAPPAAAAATPAGHPDRLERLEDEVRALELEVETLREEIRAIGATTMRTPRSSPARAAQRASAVRGQGEGV